MTATAPASSGLATSGPAGPARAAVLTRRVRLLVGATITYNAAEAAVALTAGAAASSTALLGFGLDSLIEVSSATAVAWQFTARTHQARQDRERTALRVTAVSFFALAAYVMIQALRALTGGERASTSAVGLILAAASMVVMPVLSAAQRRTGRELGSASAVADSHQTLLCTYLSAALLVGLTLHGLLGWSWADPVAGLIIAVLALLEGRRAWRGDSCCAQLPTASSVTTNRPDPPGHAHVPAIVGVQLSPCTAHGACCCPA